MRNSYENTAPPEERRTEHQPTVCADLPLHGLDPADIATGAITEATIWETAAAQYPDLDDKLEEWSIDGDHIVVHFAETYICEDHYHHEVAAAVANYLIDDYPQVAANGYTISD